MLPMYLMFRYLKFCASLLQGSEFHILRNDIRLDSTALSDYFIESNINSCISCRLFYWVSYPSQ